MNDNISAILRIALDVTVLAMVTSVILVLAKTTNDVLHQEFLAQYIRLDVMTRSKINDFARMKYINAGLAYLFIEEFHDSISSFKHYNKNGGLLESKNLTLYYYEHNAGLGYTSTYKYHERFLLNPSSTVRIQVNDTSNMGHGTIEFIVTEVN